MSPRVTLVQPALPLYRRPLFERMARRLGPGFAVYYSPGPELGVLAGQPPSSSWEHRLGPMRRLVPGLDWQVGAASIPVGHGDVVVVSGAPRTVSTLLLMLRCRLAGARLVWWGQYWSATSRPWRARLRLLFARFADGIVFYTDSEVAEYRSRGHDVTHVAALDNGLETDVIDSLRAPFHVASRDRDLLFIGRLTPKAELDLLLRALALPEASGVRLDIVGTGPEERALRELAAGLGISDRLAWHGGLVDEAAIAAVANRCRAFVYPGSVGLSLIHGLAYGLPAIIHDDRWRQMPEFAALDPGANGVVFRRGDAAALASTIGRLLGSPQLAEMSAAALATVERSYNARDMADRFCRAIERLAGSPAGLSLPAEAGRGAGRDG